MMTAETRTCQNCKNQFTIEPDDFAFYEKMAVPPPTWCPECRLWRRMVWRNERFLYRVKDAHDGREIFSMYPSRSSSNIYESNFWHSDGWDQLKTGREYDFSKPFFEQFRELLNDAPLFSRSVVDLVRSDYSNNATSLKNCYLVFGSSYVEDSLYSENCGYGKELIDSSFVNGSEVSYEGFFNLKCYRSVFSSHCEESSDIWFCRDCIGVSNCFGCVGLRNKSYYFYNQPCSKEEFQAKLRALNLSSYESLQKVRGEVEKEWRAFPVRFVRGRKNVNSTGEYVSNSKNVRESYYVLEGENLKYCQFLIIPPVKDAYDQLRYGNNTSLVYECLTAGGHSANLKFCALCYNNARNLEYCFTVLSSSDCFGCVGIHHQRFCILNKQYSEEEYRALVPKIIAHMDEMPYTDAKGKAYRYGEFFPPEFSLVPYNHSIAQEYFPLSKEEATQEGNWWIDAERRDYRSTVKAVALPDRIEDVSDNITGEIIECAHAQNCNEECTLAFKVLPEELTFYRKLGLPLPRLCPNCRFAARIKQRNPMKLWHRQCMCEKSGHQHQERCPNEFETSYAPERPETVYCEQCYNAEVV